MSEPLEPGGPVIVSVSLRNSGGVAGKEVAQLYVAHVDRTPDEPIKQLAAFAKVDLRPGETGNIELSLDSRAFSTWNVEEQRWMERPGRYHLLIGGASDDIRLTTSIHLSQTGEIRLYPED